ncbi:MAG: phosphate acyltransferase PlsX [Bacteroidia bacterium]
MRIGIDVLGGDYAPIAPLQGIANALPKLPQNTQLILLGPENLIRSQMSRLGIPPSYVQILDAPEAIDMHDNPSKAILQKPRSSIAVGMQMLKEKHLDAFISAGNTGAVLVAAVVKLGTLPGVSRPTLAAFFPYAHKKFSIICDVGANVDCKPETLLQFAELGSTFMREVLRIPNPKVALLNIGEEPSKGNLVVQQAYALFQNRSSIHFVGNAEGRDLIRGVADVYIVDGFVGNILLKFGESIYELLKENVPSSPHLELLNYENIGGLPLIGVQGNVIIGHGISGPRAFENMIFRAIEVIEAKITEKLSL